MNYCLPLGTYAGIPVKLHWTYGLMILLLGYISLEQNLAIDGVFLLSMLIVLLFICVVLHEYGHALTARRYGIQTKDIILSPIGGIARLTSIPKEPKKELWITLMGPAVNLVVAIALGIILFFIEVPVSEKNIFISIDAGYIAFFMQLIYHVFILNIAMALFNMIPAFPMDGGRVLRALLAMKWPRERATKIASIIGQIFALCFVGIGMYTNQFVLGAVGAFIFLAARAEYRNANRSQKINALLVSDVVKNKFTRIYDTDTWYRVIYLFSQKLERNFLVFNNAGQVIGVLPQLFIEEAIKEKWHNEQVGPLMSTRFTFIQENDRLKDVLPSLQKAGYTIVPVRDEYEQLVGYIDPESLRKAL